MKELSIEQKAKRYDEALKVAKDIRNGEAAYIPDGTPVIKAIFPELKDSEGERIRKALIKHVKQFPEKSLISIEPIPKVLAWLEKQGTSYTKRDVDDAYLKGVTDTKNEIEKQYEANYQIRKDIATFIFNYKGNIKDRAKWMDYLGIKVSFGEMQGEKKLADKVEPKFHEGVWITNGDYTWKIVEVKPLDYILKSQDGNTVDDTISHVDEQFHPYTIQDAKDGDVLYAKGSYFKEYIFMFSSFTEDNVISTHFGYDVFHGTFDKKITRFAREEDLISVTPATKEQRDTLERAITNAGYEWDAEKKELRKIKEKYNGEDYGIDGLYAAIDILQKTLGKVDGYQSDDGILEHKCAISAVKELSKQKPAAWSEEDEKQARQIERIVHDDGCTQKLRKQIADWLKSLKERVQQQPKQEWSEEDNEHIKSIISTIECSKAQFPNSPAVLEAYNSDLIWLKSLRPQNCWKPSDAQIKALHNLNLTGGISYAGQGQELIELYNDLIKL